MEKKIEIKWIWIVKSLICSYVITGVLLVILTVLLYKLNLNEGQVTFGIIATYIISTFGGGFVMGKLASSRKFAWGLTVGVLYFALLLLISLGIYRTLHGGGTHVLTTFVLCTLGGTLGGMVS